MSEEEAKNPEQSAAEKAFREYLRRLTRREDAELESLCARHPEIAELRREWADSSADAALDLSTTLRSQFQDEHPVTEPRQATSKADAPASQLFGQLRREQILPQRGLATGRVVGDFRLVSVLGTGGMGQVWMAEQLSLGGRKVAVKFVRPDRVSAHQLEFFAREARAGGRLQHPGIVTVFGSGESEGLQWIAMEFIEGDCTLRHFIDDLGRQDEVPEGYDREVARLIAEIADALQAAHDAGVIHRDLKPQNILITSGDKPKVMDFGLAKITDEPALSQTGEFAGTYYYMSPEQVAARRMGIDQRTDVFSLGVVLYEMLALRRPFEGDTSHQVATQILTRDPPDLRTIRSRVPGDLVVIVGKALEKDPARRYQTMSELAADLRRFLGNEPILAKPPTRWERTVKWVRRNPTKSVSATVAAVLFVVIAILLGKNVQASRDLSTSNTSLETERTNLANEVTSVKRLSALQTLEDLIAEANDAEKKWPAYPVHIRAFQSWMGRARDLVDELDLHRTRRDELRALARPRTEEERRKDREGHAQYSRFVELGEEMAQRRRVLARRRGDEARESPEEPAALDEANPTALMERAEALFTAGRDDEALEAAYAALDTAGEEEKEAFEARYQSVEERVTAAASAEGMAQAETEIATLQGEHDALDAVVDERRDWQFPEEHDEARWWNNQLTKLIEGLEALENEETGLLGEKAVSLEHGWSVPRRLALAQELEEAFEPGGEHDVRWKTALPEMAKAYPGLKLSIQMGLVPIGADPASGLWEFWHVQTGAEPVRDENGQLQVTEETGLALVLLRGGAFLMGGQPTDPAGPNHDEKAASNEGPVHEVELSPLLLSKYEMTQGQWLRVTGENPSAWHPEGPLSGVTLRHPVEMVHWDRAHLVLRRLGLDLPSEAQWEYGCRAGSNTPFSCPADELAAHANLADQAYDRRLRSVAGTETWDDGFGGHAPVGSLAPNAWGLHDVHGNVWEWCVDGYQEGFYAHSPPVDPISPWRGAAQRVNRGGSFNYTAVFARSVCRNNAAPSRADTLLGVRPARVLDPPGTGFREE